MSKKILVCDDAEDILEVIKIILEDNDYEVQTVPECNNIVDLVKDFKPDLVLLDLWIKDMDGREIAKLIRAEGSIANTPIFFISALNELDMIAEESGVQGFIKKPFEMAEFIAKINSAFE